jgi:hypothetical protein
MFVRMNLAARVPKKDEGLMNSVVSLRYSALANRSAAQAAITSTIRDFGGAPHHGRRNALDHHIHHR